MKEKLVMIGAGGHGKVCAEIAKLNGYQTVVFLDDQATHDAAAAGPTSDFMLYIPDYVFFVAIGNAQTREAFVGKILDAGGTLVSLIHPHSTVSESAIIGWGSVVMAGAVINPGAVLGNGVIINTCSSIDHDCSVGDFAHVSVGSHLCGTVTVGAHTWIGTGATVSNDVSICGDCMIGAGTVVIRNIQEPGTYVGVPCRRIK